MCLFLIRTGADTFILHEIPNKPMNEITSRYAGRCKVCKAMWKVDDKLYIEKGVDRWCSSQSCATGNAAGVLEPQQAAPQAPSQATAEPASTGDKFAQTSATHDKLWEMAGRKIESVDFSTFVDDRETQQKQAHTSPDILLRPDKHTHGQFSQKIANPFFFTFILEPL